MANKRYNELGVVGKALVLVIAAVSIAIVGRAERDISRRDEDQVRGSRTAWRLASLNALGAIAYLRFGRR